METKHPNLVGRRSEISIAKSKASKEVIKSKQLTIKWVVREGKPHSLNVIRVGSDLKQLALKRMLLVYNPDVCPTSKK